MFSGNTPLTGFKENECYDRVKKKLPSMKQTKRNQVTRLSISTWNFISIHVGSTLVYFKSTYFRNEGPKRRISQLQSRCRSLLFSLHSDRCFGDTSICYAKITNGRHFIFQFWLSAIKLSWGLSQGIFQQNSVIPCSLLSICIKNGWRRKIRKTSFRLKLTAKSNSR